MQRSTTKDKPLRQENSRFFHELKSCEEPLRCLTVFVRYLEESLKPGWERTMKLCQPSFAVEFTRLYAYPIIFDSAATQRKVKLNVDIG